MNISEKIAALRGLMKEHNMDAYIIPSDDYHQSEYVGDFFKARAFISGFTGSAGTVVVTLDKAGLWTDGRYFIQAARELSGSGIDLYKSGNPGVPTIEEFLEAELPEKGNLGFDGRVISIQTGKKYAEIVEKKQGTILYAHDLIESLWTDRPSLSMEPAFLLDTKYAGESISSKLERLRGIMQEKNVSAHVMASLDDIAWLFNIRGKDVAYSPLVLCYAVIRAKSAELYIEKSKLGDDILAEFAKNQVVLYDYNQIYDRVKEFTADDTVLIDPAKINYALYHNIPENVEKTEADNPTTLMKALKNDVELENTINAHIKDGIAHTKFMYWLKTSIGHTAITELSASEKLESLRKEQEGFLWPSFAPICAYGAHAAMCHYSSSEETNCELLPGSLFLTDTGGNYYEGSTDITRTVAIGEVSDDLKKHFTAVAQSMLTLANAKFLDGCQGYNLDILARQPIWNLGIDYNHGTGHGIGYLLNIHEGPTSFHWRIRPERLDTYKLEPGMILTDEPGIYIEDSHGIRLENELVVRKGEKTAHGQFLYFEPITYVPLDLDAIDPELMNSSERKWLNEYHQKVYETIAPHLTEEERAWLKTYTREV